MNLFQQEDALKGLPDQRLAQEMQEPSGMVPQYMVMAELNRRKKMREQSAASPDDGVSVADEMRMAMQPDQIDPPQQEYQDGGLVLPPQEEGASIWDSMSSMFGFSDAVVPDTGEREHIRDMYGVPKPSEDEISQEAFDLLKATGNNYAEGGAVVEDATMWDSLKAMFGSSDAIPQGDTDERDYMRNLFVPDVGESNDEAFRRLQQEQNTPIGYREGGRIRDVGKTVYAEGGSVFDRPTWAQLQALTAGDRPYETRYAARKEMDRLMREKPPLSSEPALTPPVVGPMRSPSNFDGSAQRFTDSLNAQYSGGIGSLAEPSSPEAPSVEIPRGTTPEYATEVSYPRGGARRNSPSSVLGPELGGMSAGPSNRESPGVPEEGLQLLLDRSNIGPSFNPAAADDIPGSVMDPFMDAARTDAPDVASGIVDKVGDYWNRGKDAFMEGYNSSPRVPSGDAAARRASEAMDDSIPQPVADAIEDDKDEARVSRPNPTPPAEMVPSGSTVGVAGRTTSMDALSDYEQMRRVIGFEPGAQDKLINDLEAKQNALRGDVEGDYKNAKWMAMVDLGAAMASGESPYFAANFGKGATAGIASLRGAKKDKRDAEMAFLGMDADITQARIAAQKGDVDTAAQIYKTALDKGFKQEELSIARQRNAIAASNGGGTGSLKLFNAQYDAVQDRLKAIAKTREDSLRLSPEDKAQLDAEERYLLGVNDVLIKQIGLPSLQGQDNSRSGIPKNPIRGE